MQISETLDERLPRLGMASVKLLDEARSDRLRARPALEAVSVPLIAGFNFRQRGQHPLYLCGQSAAFRLGQGRWFVNPGSWHGKPPSFLFLGVFYTQRSIRNTGLSRSASKHGVA